MVDTTRKTRQDRYSPSQPPQRVDTEGMLWWTFTELRRIGQSIGAAHDDAQDLADLMLPDAPSDGLDYVRNSGAWVAINWTTLDGKPSTFPPSAHTHPISEVTGLTDALDGKVDVAGDTMTGSLFVPNVDTGVIVGTDTPPADTGSYNPSFLSVTEAGSNRFASIAYCYGNVVGNTAYLIRRTRGATYNDHGATVEADVIGAVSFDGNDGTSFQRAATSRAVAHAASTGVVPGSYELMTSQRDSATNRIGYRLTPDQVSQAMGEMQVGASMRSFDLDVEATTETGKTFSVNAQEVIPRGLYFKPDGTMMFVIGQGARRVKTYDLSTAWDVTTAVYNAAKDGANLGLEPDLLETIAGDLTFSPDGVHYYAACVNANKIAQYTMSTPWNPATGVYTAALDLTPSGIASAYAVEISPDGTSLYVGSAAGGSAGIPNLFQFALGTAWSVATATLYGSAAPGITGLRSLDISPCGRYMLATSTTADVIHLLFLSKPFDVLFCRQSSRTFVTTGGGEGVADGMYARHTLDGAYLYVVGTDVDTVTEYLMPRTVGRMEAAEIVDLRDVTVARFDTAAGFVVGEGELAWNADEGTLDLGMGANGATQQIGLETYFHVKADSLITDGQVIMATGAVGASGKITAAPATGLAIDQGLRIIGIATQTIAAGEFGYVTCFGMVRGIDTSAWAEGTVLFYDPATTGGLTSTLPDAPNVRVTVAMVTRQGNNGTLMVRVSHGSVLGSTDSNVQFGTLANRDFMAYNATAQRWENRPIVAGDVDGFKTLHGFPRDEADNALLVVSTYSTAARTVTLTAVAPNNTFDLYWLGDKYTFNSGWTSDPHPATAGAWFLIFNNGTFSWSQTPWDLCRDCPVTYVYYSDVAGEGLALKELHGAERNGEWHEWAHRTFGTVLRAGGVISGYTLDSDVDADIQFAIAETQITDEDIEHVLAAKPDGPGFTIFYRSGVNGVWTWAANQPLPFLYGTTPQINTIVGGAWTMVDINGISSGSYATAYVVAVPSLESRFNYIVVPGQTEYTSLVDAEKETVSDLNAGSFSLTEACPIAKIIIHGKTAFGNASNSVLSRVDRLAGSFVSIAGNSLQTTHNTLALLQGGALGEYFHLNFADYTAALGLQSKLDAKLAITTAATTYQPQQQGNTVNGVRVLDATYVGTLNVAAQETVPTGVFFSPDGARMFIIGQQRDYIVCYGLATPWTISSGATYDAALNSVNFNTAHGENTAQAIVFKEDGTKFWVVGTTQNTVYQYTMSTPWDPSTGTYDSKSLVVTNGGAELVTTGLAMSTDGVYLFTAGNTLDSVFRFTMSTPFDISTASTTPSQTLSLSGQETVLRGIRFTRDGRKMYAVGSTGDDINEYLLSTAWDLSTAVFTNALSLSASGFTVPQDVYLSPCGRHMYAVDSTAQAVARYSVPSDGLAVVGPADVTGDITGRGAILSTDAIDGVGYTTGAGGTVTQATSKTTGVTLNKITGKITLNNATLNAGAAAGFTLTNQSIGANDIVVASIASGATADSYSLTVDAVAAGSCRFSLRNVSAGDLSEAVVINYAVIKGAAA